MSTRNVFATGLTILIITGATVWSQTNGRRHVATQVQKLSLVPATEEPPTTNQSTIEHSQGQLHVESNGIPKHLVGRFPNRGNPHAIRSQRYKFNLPENPKPADKVTSIYFTNRFGPPNMPFGVAMNGVLFDPGTAEFWQGNRGGGWNYEALGGAVPLGIDENFAHVQPQGAYHYHGIPDQLVKDLGFDSTKHSPLVGWAADGFPIYCKTAYRDPKDPMSEIVSLRPGFRLKEGDRPGGDSSPGGTYDGTFFEDYEYAAGTGDLDECNGRFCKTPEFPDGTYAYFLTTQWPVIPRAFKGQPVKLR